MAGLLLKKDAWEVDNSNNLKPLGQKWFSLDKAEKIIGRVSPADIILPSPIVARTEAKIGREKETYYLENIAIRGGIALNEELIRGSASKLFQDGDEIRVGCFCFVFMDREGNTF